MGPFAAQPIHSAVRQWRLDEFRRADYLYAQYTTRRMGFVDDVEFWYDPEAKAIQVRSASRLGQRDMGVNRQRVEAVRKALADLP